MPSSFAGFPPEALQFFEDLEQNNNREWFQPRKEQFEHLVRTPMLELVSAVNDGLAKFAPEHITDPKKAVFRIYRDTRFSPNKTPYKNHIAASFHRRGLEKVGAAGFYFSVNHKVVELGGGIYHPPPDTLFAVRTHIAATYPELRELAASRRLKKLMGELKGEELARAPKGFDSDHPALDLVKKKDWVFFSELEPTLAISPKLLENILTRFELLAPVLAYLNRPLLGKKAARTMTSTGLFN